MNSIPIKREDLDTETHCGREWGIERECHIKMKAEIRVTFLQTNDYQRLPAKHQKLDESQGTNASLTTLRSNQPG